MVPDYIKWFIGGIAASAGFLYIVSLATSDPLYRYLAYAFMIPVWAVGLYLSKQEKQERQKKHAQELNALKQKERQLYADALIKWAEDEELKD